MTNKRLLELVRAQRELAKAFVLAFRNTDASEKEEKEEIKVGIGENTFLINFSGCFIVGQENSEAQAAVNDEPQASSSSHASKPFQKTTAKSFGDVEDDFNPLDNDDERASSTPELSGGESDEEAIIEERPNALPNGHQPYCLVSALFDMYKNYKFDRNELIDFFGNHLKPLIESIIPLPDCADIINQMVHWFPILRQQIADFILQPDTLKTILNHPGSSEILSKTFPECASDIQGKLSADSFSYHPGFLSSSLPASLGQTSRHRPRTTSSNGSFAQNGLYRTSTPAMAISSLRMGASKFS